MWETYLSHQRYSITGNLRECQRQENWRNNVKMGFEVDLLATFNLLREYLTLLAVVLICESKSHKISVETVYS